MEIVSVEKIPRQTKEVLDLAEAHKIFRGLRKICDQYNALGINATQVGIDLNLFLVKTNNRYRCFINCNYCTTTDEIVYGIEGCLSLPNQLYRVKRFKEIRVIGQELVLRDKKPTTKLVDFVTNDVVFAHELDHSRGILISDIGLQVK